MQAIQAGKPKPKRLTRRKVVEKPLSSTAGEAVTTCETLKTKGNKLFREGDVDGAQTAYQKCIEGAVEGNAHYSNAELAKCAVAAASNLAMACIKKSAFGEAMKACSLAFGMQV